MLGVILNQVNKLLGRLTEQRATNLDKLAISGSTVADADVVHPRMTKIDNIDSKMPASGTIPATTDVPSSADYTSTRAGRLDYIYPIPQIKVEAGRIPLEEFNLDVFAFHPPNAVSGGQAFSADGRFGARVVYAFIDTSNTLVNAVDVTGSGWLLGAMQVNISSSTPYTSTFKVRIDGTFIYEHTGATLGAKRGRVPVGFVFAQSDNSVVLKVPVINVWYPVRFESSLRVVHKANNYNIQTHVVYLLD